MSQEKYNGPPDTHRSFLKQLPLTELPTRAVAQKKWLLCACDLLTCAQPTNLSPQMISSIPNPWTASKQPPPLITKSPAYHKNAIFFLQAWIRQKQGLHITLQGMKTTFSAEPLTTLGFSTPELKNVKKKKKKELHVLMMTGILVFKSVMHLVSNPLICNPVRVKDEVPILTGKSVKTYFSNLTVRGLLHLFKMTCSLAVTLAWNHPK